MLWLTQGAVAAPIAGGMEMQGVGTATTAVANLAPARSGNFVGSNIMLYEAHWQGMDVMKLTAELRQQLGYPKGMQGAIINEVTLNAALSGMLGGDIIVSIKERPVVDLESFQQATREVKDQRHAAVTVMRKGSQRDANGRYGMRRMVYIIRARLDLGFAQVEGAPMILPGDPRPHPYRGPCTDCHTVGDGTFTMPDPDLITLPPPDLSAEVMDSGRRPHRDRGPCVACHKRLPGMVPVITPMM